MQVQRKQAKGLPASAANEVIRENFFLSLLKHKESCYAHSFLNLHRKICKAFFTCHRLSPPPHSATMTVYARVARTAGRTAVRAQRRQMGGSHAPAPEWTGIDKVVRGYFPEDYQREFYRKHGSYRLLASPTRGSRYKNTDTTNGDENRRQQRWLEEAFLVGRSKYSGTAAKISGTYCQGSYCNQELKQAHHVLRFRQSRWQPRRPRPRLDSQESVTSSCSWLEWFAERLGYSRFSSLPWQGYDNYFGYV